jgi:hypothetical protein
MRKLTLSIGAAVLATAGVAVAAPQMAGHMQADMTRAQAQTMAAEHFAKMDANGDGKLDSADRAARQAKIFDRIDADHNGSISRDEFAAMHAQRGERGGERAGVGRQGMMGGDHGGRGRHGMHGGMGGRGMMLGKMVDTNNDGTITQAEFTAAALAHFDKADADHNGTVTAAERKAAFDAMKSQWQARRAAAPAPAPSN